MGRRNAGRGGYTMLEILVAVGIILILMAIGVIGYRGYDKSASTGRTDTVLKAGQGMVANYEGAGNSVTNMAGTAVMRVGDVNAGGGARAAALNNGKGAMQKLLSIPANKDALGQIPTKSFVAEAGVRQQALADGWGNPVVLVPATGMLVKVKDSAGTVVDTTIKAPGNRPFWASAGPDGNFGGDAAAYADDNVYSFER